MAKAAKYSDITDPLTPIMIVDDNLQYSSILKRMLEGAFGYSEITVVDRIDDAYELIVDEPDYFRLLFVDYNFPEGRTGGELLTRLKAEGVSEGIIMFLITSDPTSENVSEALNAGALGVVAKPFDRGELVKQLEKAHRTFLAQNTESF